MKLLKLLLILQILVFIAFSNVFGFSTHDTNIQRTFDEVETGIDDLIVATVRFTHVENDDLRGFFYTEQIPDNLQVSTISVKINDTEVSNYIFQFGLNDDVYLGSIPYRWILETPLSFLEENPIPEDVFVEIVYSVTSDAAGVFNLDEFNWVGYFQDASSGERASFGHSEEGDRQVVTFTGKPGDGNIDGSDEPDEEGAACFVHFLLRF